MGKALGGLAATFILSGAAMALLSGPLGAIAESVSLGLGGATLFTATILLGGRLHGRRQPDARKLATRVQHVEG